MRFIARTNCRSVKLCGETPNAHNAATASLLQEVVCMGLNTTSLAANGRESYCNLQRLLSVKDGRRFFDVVKDIQNLELASTEVPETATGVCGKLLPTIMHDLT